MHDHIIDTTNRRGDRLTRRVGSGHKSGAPRTPRGVLKPPKPRLAFYRSLGFTSRWQWKADDGKLAYAGVGLGDAVIALGRITSDRGGDEYDDYRTWVSSPLGAGVMVNVEVRGVERIYARAKKVRAKVESRLREWPYGTAFTINDPDGYVVKFLRSKGEFA